MAKFNACTLLFATIICFASCVSQSKTERSPLTKVRTLTGANDVRFGEIFGIAVDKNNRVFVSDGANGKIYQIERDGNAKIISDKFDTPSSIAVDGENNLIIADSGSSTIKRLNTTNSNVEIIAGIENQFAFRDGSASQSLFNAPIGVAVDGDKIYVADTYNDKIRVIENGNVRTIAGSETGFADSVNALSAKFNTPCGIAVDKNKNILVADTMNRRIRKIDASGFVSTFIGNDTRETKNGFANETSFVEPVGVQVDKFGAIYVSDEGANAVRVFGRKIINFSETLTGGSRGLIDANLLESKFNRPTNIAFDENGNLLIADSANKIVRIVEPENENSGAEISAETAKSLFVSAEDLKKSLEPRWTYNPPQNPREIAGTFGEIRGYIKPNEQVTHFHNGLDIAGNYGETARFLKSEKNLRPIAAENFGDLRELLRLPKLGYIHIRLGRDANQKPFDDARFQFQTDANNKLTNVRIRRGAKFQTGEAIGTLNPMNHVHLIAGESGNEMNAFTALNLPDVKDSVAPKIEKVTIYNENWNELNTNVSGKMRVVVRAFDQMNGNLSRRKLGVFRFGYQVVDANNKIVSDNFPTISFERIPDDEREVAKLYATGSQSGATGETIFNYIITNNLQDGVARENFLDTTKMQNGDYTIRVFATDFFKNQSTQDLKIRVAN